MEEIVPRAIQVYRQKSFFQKDLRSIRQLEVVEIKYQESSAVFTNIPGVPPCVCSSPSFGWWEGKYSPGVSFLHCGCRPTCVACCGLNTTYVMVMAKSMGKNKPLS
jgi:hypothetical protein